MNYPFRTALLDYLQGGGAEPFVEQMETLRENYPPFAFYSAMNALGTHDTMRVLTLLGTGGTRAHKSKDERAAYRMTDHERSHGTRLLKVGAAVLFCFPGSPTIYYGDEAGMEGFEDPFNRRTFPWGRENKELTEWFAALGSLRKTSPALRKGELRELAGTGSLLRFERRWADERILCLCNAEGEDAAAELPRGGWDILLGEGYVEQGTLRLPPYSAVILRNK